MATLKMRVSVLDGLTSGMWLPAIGITVINFALFWALFSSIAGR